MRPSVPTLWFRRAALWAALAASAAVAQAREQAREPAQEPAQEQELEGLFRRHLGALTHDDMEGRAVGSAGGQRAIAYIEQQMRAVGLAPLPGLSRSFRQEFSVDDPTPRRPVAASTTLRADLPDGARAFGLGAGFAPLGFSPNGEVRGELAFVGYGLRVPDLDHDDYAGLDVRGKVVLALRGAPGWPNTAERFRERRRALWFSTKIALAHENGAVGFLLVDPRERDAQRGRTIAELAAAARGSADVPCAWVSRDVANQLLSATGRCLQTRKSVLDGATGGRRARFDAAGFEVAMHVELGPQRPELQTANVVGMIVGRDPALAEEYVVLGAHHDHLGRGQFGSLAPESVGQVHPGADDNASGVAALLVTARALASRRPAPRRSLVFVAFGAEETGLRGSREFLQRGPLPRKRITAMINLDMIGRASEDRLRIEGVGSADGLPAIVDEIGRELGMRLRQRDTVAPRSDHWTFIRREIPALFLHSGLHDQYHRPADLPSLVMVPEALRVVAVVEALALRLADRPERLRFRPDVVRKSYVK